MAERIQERIENHWQFMSDAGYDCFQSYNSYNMKKMIREISEFYKEYFSRESEFGEVVEHFIRYSDIDYNQDDLYLYESDILTEAMPALMEYCEKIVDQEDSLDRIIETDLKEVDFDENDQLKRASDRAYMKKKIIKHGCALFCIDMMTYYVSLSCGHLGIFDMAGAEDDDPETYRHPKLYDGKLRPVFAHEAQPGDVSPFDGDFENLLAALSNTARLYAFYVYRNVKDMNDGTVKFRLYRYSGDDGKAEPCIVSVDKEPALAGLEESGGRAIWPRLYLEALKKAGIPDDIRTGELVPICFGPDFTYLNYDERIQAAKQDKQAADDLYLHIQELIENGAMITVYLNDESEDYREGAFYITGTYNAFAEDDDRVVRMYDVFISNVPTASADAPLTDVYYTDLLKYVTAMDVNLNAKEGYTHIRRKDYDLIGDDALEEYNKTLFDQKECRSYIKCLYEINSMLLTTVTLSKEESEAFMSLLSFSTESLWHVMLGLGSTRKIMKNQTAILKKMSDNYRKNKGSEDFKIGFQRLKVCSAIDKLYELSLAEDPVCKDPYGEFKKSYALKVADYICRKKGMNTTPEMLEANAAKLLADARFSKLMSKLTIITMNSASDKHIAAMLEKK